MLHCDLRVRWKVASDLRCRAAISEPKTSSFCRISDDLAPSVRKSLAIAIVRFWCAKFNRQTWFWFRFRFLKNDSGGSNLLSGPGKTVPWSESSEWGQCSRGQSEISHFPVNCSHLPLSEENEEKNEEKRKKTKTCQNFPPTPSSSICATPLRTSQR